MLKKSILIIFALAMTVQASAKGGLISTEFGVTAGLRYNSLSLKNAPNAMTAKPGMTYNVGLHASVAVLGVAIQPELNYGYTSVKINAPQSALAETTVKAHDLEIPVLVSLRFLPIVRFNVGPVFNVMGKGNYKDASGTKVMFGGLHPSCGYAVGVSVALLHKLLIDARFVGYFKQNAHINNFEGLDLNTKTYSGGIKIGYLF